MFHTQFSWNKKQVKTKTENKTAAKILKRQGKYFLSSKREKACKHQIKSF